MWAEKPAISCRETPTIKTKICDEGVRVEE